MAQRLADSRVTTTSWRTTRPEVVGSRATPMPSPTRLAIANRGQAHDDKADRDTGKQRESTTHASTTHRAFCALASQSEPRKLKGAKIRPQTVLCGATWPRGFAWYHTTMRRGGRSAAPYSLLRRSPPSEEADPGRPLAPRRRVPRNKGCHGSTP